MISGSARGPLKSDRRLMYPVELSLPRIRPLPRPIATHILHFRGRPEMGRHEDAKSELNQEDDSTSSAGLAVLL